MTLGLCAHLLLDKETSYIKVYASSYHHFHYKHIIAFVQEQIIKWSKFVDGQHMTDYTAKIVISN